MKRPTLFSHSVLTRHAHRALVALPLLALCCVSALADSEELRLSGDTVVNFNPMGCISNVICKKDPVIKEGMLMAEKKIGEGTVANINAKSVIHQSWTSVLDDKGQYQSKDNGGEFSGTIIDSKSPGKPREIEYAVTYTKLADNKLRVQVSATYLADSVWFGKLSYNITLPFSFYSDGTVSTQTTRGQDDRVTLNSEKPLAFKGLFSQVAVMKDRKGVIIEGGEDCQITLNDARQWKQNVLSVAITPKITEWKDAYPVASGEKTNFEFQITIKSE